MCEEHMVKIWIRARLWLQFDWISLMDLKLCVGQKWVKRTPFSSIQWLERSSQSRLSACKVL
jgi:hypothetical protein